jgi:hypothetical protein
VSANSIVTDVPSKTFDLQSARDSSRNLFSNVGDGVDAIHSVPNPFCASDFPDDIPLETFHARVLKWVRITKKMRSFNGN